MLRNSRNCEAALERFIASFQKGSICSRLGRWHVEPSSLRFLPQGSSATATMSSSRLLAAIGKLSIGHYLDWWAAEAFKILDLTLMQPL